jgi:hypothetical protein
MASKEDQSILDEAKERFGESLDYYSEERNRMAEELRFASGEQWPDNIRRARENDPNGARPCLTMDKLGQYRRQVVNDARQNKPSIKVRPVDSGADVEVADLLQGFTRHIEDASCADIAYDCALESATGPGIGWFRLRTKVVNAAKNEQEIVVDPIENIFSVHPDCCWKRPDGSDLEWCFVTDDVPRKQYEKDYPKADLTGWESDDKNTEWIGKETVKVAEYFRIKTTSENVLVLDNGQETTEAAYWETYASDEMRPQIVETYANEKRVVEWFKLSCGEILDRTEIPSEWIPVIPVIGNAHWIDGKRQLTGMTYWAKDAQRAYNYARSAFVEQIALAPKAPFVAAAGQVEPYKSEWQKSNTSNQPVLRYDPIDINGQALPPPQRQMPPQPSSGWFQEMQVSEGDVQSSLGMYAASLGGEGQEKSGRAILARQKEGDTSTFHYIDNLSRSIRHAGRIIVGMIPRIMDTRRMVRILGEDGASSQATIDPTMQEPMRKVRTQAGKVIKLFNPSIGRYDVSVSVGPAYNTRRMESADMMVEMTRGNPELFPVIGDLMVQAMDWPMADLIAKRLKAMAPPQIQQIGEEDEGGESPEVAMVKQQAEQIIGQLQEQMQQMQQALQQSAQEADQAKAEAMRANMRAESAKLQAQETEVEAASQMLAKDVQIARAELAAEESDAVARVTQLVQGNPEESEPEEPEAPEPAAPVFDPMAMMQAFASMQQPINITVPVTVDGKAGSVKTGRAIRQSDGSYTLEAIEQPLGGMQ